MQANWAQAARHTRFLWLPIPAYASLPLLLWIMHMSWATLGFVFVVVSVLSYLSWRGRTIPWVVRRFGSFLRAGVVHARPKFFRRRMQSLGGVDFLELKE
jgi:hypothetical protein